MWKDVRGKTSLGWTPGPFPTWSKHMCVASLSAAVTVGGKVKAMKCLGSNRAWLKQSPWPGQEANFMQLTRERMKGGGGGGGAPWTQSTQQPNVHHTAICPQQPINWWKGQRVISYQTWQLLMCTEVKHLKWRMREFGKAARSFTPSPSNLRLGALNSSSGQWSQMKISYLWNFSKLIDGQDLVSWVFKSTRTSFICSRPCSHYQWVGKEIREQLAKLSRLHFYVNMWHFHAVTIFRT